MELRHNKAEVLLVIRNTINKLCRTTHIYAKHKDKCVRMQGKHAKNTT